MPEDQPLNLEPINEAVVNALAARCQALMEGARAAAEGGDIYRSIGFQTMAHNIKMAETILRIDLERINALNSNESN